MQIFICLMITQITICLIIMQITICLIIMQITICWSLCKSPSVWSICADYHLSDSSCKYYTAIKVIIIVILMHNSKISKETLMHNSRYPYVKCICHSIVKLLYTGKGKRGIRRTWNWRTKMHSTMHYHYAHWTACMFLLLVTINC